MFTSAWMSEAFEGLLLNLTDPFPGDVELLTHLIEGAFAAATESETQAQDLGLSVIEGLQDALYLAAEVFGYGDVVGEVGLVVFEESHQALAIVAHRFVEGDRLEAGLDD